MSVPAVSAAVALLVLGSFTAVFATPSETFAATIGVGATTKPFVSDTVLKCFGSSHAATALRSDWQAQLTKVQRDLGTEFVRFHGLLDDDMSVVLEYKTIHSDDDIGAEGAAQMAVSKNCTFKPHVDYADPAGPVVNVSSQAECCAACYNTPTGLPQPCVAAVYTDGGQCYTKLSTSHPVSKPNVGVTACVTDRPSPKGFMYSWVNVFKVFDFLRSINMRPVVELSFMPSLLASDPTSVGFWYRGGRSVPKSFSDWRAFMVALSNALVDRYGLNEVEKWYFEVWNEPNCGFYDMTNCCGPTCGNKTAYLELFVNTFQAIKGAHPTLRVGGPATAQLAWLDTFLEGAVAAKCDPDFLSTHLYPTDPYINHTRDGFAEAIEDAVGVASSTAAKLGKETPPILITEFNCGLGINCADAPYAASMVAHQALRAQRTAGSVVMESYWTFSDVFEEQGQQPSEFSQAFGAQSINGVPKPVYRAMQLLRRLLPDGVAVSREPRGNLAVHNETVDVVVTQARLPDNTSFVVEAMVSNHPGGPAKQPEWFDGSLAAFNAAHLAGHIRPRDDQSAVNVTIAFTGPKPPVVSVRRVDDQHSNALRAYANMGRPPYPSPDQLKQLQAASELAEETIIPVREGPSTWTVSLVMPSFSVASLSFHMSSV